MDIFRRYFFIALLAGVISGGVITVAHQFGSVPIILEAEVYEKAAEEHGHPDTPHDAAVHDAATLERAATEHEHEHGAKAWEPEDGLERTVYTGLADLLTGVGFALLLIAAYALKGDKVDWRKGVFWGLAGFAAFTLAPTLGLPLEVPGTAAAPLLGRQLWWAGTVLATGGGLALFAFRRQPLWVVAGVALIVLPHLIGAPQPDVHSSAAPAELAHRFIVAATVTSLLFWMCLGASTGYLYRRFCQEA